jgi:5-(aminomethyl)-3-furanmethanol phosphate kinase
MWVIKLGGSLMDSPLLSEWLTAIDVHCRGTAVIVPGGGMFAEQVRKSQLLWSFNDSAAHKMAILAMQQMALLFQGINGNLSIASSKQSIKAALKSNKTVVWSPDLQWLVQSSLPDSWDVTSDSLSAWLSAQLQAEQLVLVKSATIPSSSTLAQLTEKGIVDKYFCQLIQVELKVFHRSQLHLFTTLVRRQSSMSNRSEINQTYL